jgi:hypothetical protein
MNEREFMYRMMAMMRATEEEEKKPVKHYGFGLPKLYQIVDTATGNAVTANEHKEAAVQYAEQTSEQVGHRFEVRGIWR